MKTLINRMRNKNGKENISSISQCFFVVEMAVSFTLSFGFICLLFVFFFIIQFVLSPVGLGTLNQCVFPAEGRYYWGLPSEENSSLSSFRPPHPFLLYGKHSSAL